MYQGGAGLVAYLRQATESGCITVLCEGWRAVARAILGVPTQPVRAVRPNVLARGSYRSLHCTVLQCLATASGVGTTHLLMRMYQPTHPSAAPPRTPQVFRQEDQELVGLLGDIRNGTSFQAHAALDNLLNVCSGPLDTADGILPTHLHGRNAEVDKKNEEALAELPGDAVRAS